MAKLILEPSLLKPSFVPFGSLLLLQHLAGYRGLVGEGYSEVCGIVRFVG